MNVPDSPEALFEALAEPSLREFYPDFDQLKPRNQKLIRLLHCELTKGELSDATFQEFIGFALVLWRSYNRSALQATQAQIDTEDEIDTDWVDAAIALARTEQYITSLLAALDPMPCMDSDGVSCDSQYLIHRAEDS